MNAKDFRTKTFLIPRRNATPEDKYPVGIDIGYSGTKIFTPNKAACFPSYAVPVKGGMISFGQANKDTDIYYREDKNSQMWVVGRHAQDMISPTDANANSLSIYGRKRYADPMFLVLARTALGISLLKNDYGSPEDKKIVLRTGLPNAYLTSDTDLLKEVFEGHHVFDLSVGNSGWRHFDITLTGDQIGVLAQPMGTLFSVSTDNAGNVTEKGAEILSSKVLIVDIGFETLDTFALKYQMMEGVETFDDLGMKEVLKRTSEEILKKYHTEIPVPAMQSYLETGKASSFDRKAMVSTEFDFTPILEEKSNEVALAAVFKLIGVYDYFMDYDYLILTGGTGEAWYSVFLNTLKGMSNLHFIPGNSNDEKLPFTMANARGYYMSALNS